MQDVWIIDTTLRDGEQAPGVSFTQNEKIELSLLLNEIGIDEIEVGTPAMGHKEVETFRKIKEQNLNSKLLVWCRALKKDILQAKLTGIERVHIAVPVSTIQQDSINKDLEYFLNNLSDVIGLVRDNFSFISIGLQDASRCDFDILSSVIKNVCEYKIDRIRFADTTGILTPKETYEILTNIRLGYPSLSIDFHAHNDLGLATANAITAYSSGVKCISTTVNGLGERAGNAALEEVLMLLYLKYNNNRYKLSLLHQLCQYVSKISNRQIPVDKPIVGELILSHESGIHVKGTLNNPLAYQAFSGECIGREKCQILFGKHSGSSGLKNILNKNRIHINNSEFETLLGEIRNKASKDKRYFTEMEIIDYFLNKK